MKLKFAIAFAAAGLMLAGTKSYEISLSQVSKAGTVDLQAGDYKVAVTGSKATFTALKTGKSVETDITVQTAEKKFALTTVDAEAASGTNKIHEIDLGGTTTKVMFQ
jgi:VCBS repeat-containing protein